MCQIIRQLHRFVIRIVALSFIFTSLQPQLLLAQAANTEDFEAPTITLSEINSGKLGDDQSFTVTAVDNDAVKTVSFFYRFDVSADFQEVAMQPNGKDYSVSIPTRDVQASAIQYYIQAEDNTGNRALKGYNFDPLERRLESSELLATSATPAPKKKSRTLYYVLGVLAVLALGAAAGGGGSSDDGGGGGGDCDASGCLLSVTVGAP